MLMPTAPQLCSHLYVVLGINCIYAGQREQGEEEEEDYSQQDMARLMRAVPGKGDDPAKVTGMAWMIDIE